ncbi:GNAT family N-acetyltransferase [Jeotgalibacillus sp. ET6]|uniref:GNAT family N-acetyltransferase n=1 Tax=Jeotgalibacillus sp. ET6 TaxID=3037260 RepID=UPI0024188DC7|nr:GNAT family N-acetyltransferase [Jeotgalibacillus sp. ET6]MDG5471892.1 GNAT family N-acetyltransferase [Jeotgalibacillus sp. ET6]
MIIQLTGQHAKEYRELRLQALLRNPEAFAASYEEEKELSIEAFQTRLELPGFFTFGEWVDEKLVGTVTLIPQKKEKLRHKSDIVAMYVDPQYRQKGIGRKLIEKAIQQAGEIKEVEQVLLTVVESNANAKRLYTSLGFKPFGLEKKALKLNGVYIDEEYMKLEMN